MWAIRVLTGSQSGQVFELKTGRNLVGRAAHCDLKITSTGVSKEHTEIVVSADKIVVTDLKSSNGTFLNGVRIQHGVMRLGDKLGFHNILVDLVPAVSQKFMPVRQQPEPGPQKVHGVQKTQRGYRTHQHQMPQYGGGTMENLESAPAPTPAPAYQAGGLKGFTEKISEYIEMVALPGVYKLPTLIEFKMVLLGFVILFIFSTTLLAMIPMIAISKSSILTESKRRAGSIARTVATLNQVALLQNSLSGLTTNQAEAEDGVKQVLIIQQSDGMILAPASRAGTIPDIPFVHVARREMRPQSVEIDSSTIGASFPIGLFDPNTGEQSVKAHAIVLYDAGSLNFDDGRTISLFMQALLISSVIGLIIFYFMYKLIEYPISNLNSQLDIAMREKKDSTDVDFIFPAFQALVGNINSLLTRYVHGAQEPGQERKYSNKDSEAENLIHLIGYPALALGKEGRIISCSPTFANLVRTEPANLQGQLYTSITDTSMQQNIEDLVARCRENPLGIQHDELDFAGQLCRLSCQAMSAGDGSIEYYLITVAPIEGGS